MKILMLGWELPPHNSGGLGVACYELCKALSQKGADIDFILPYTADHAIDFMRINPAHSQDISEIVRSGMAYDSAKYVYKNGKTEYLNIVEQAQTYEDAVGRIAESSEFDVIHAHDWLTCRAGLRAKMTTGKPLIVHLHSIEADRSGQQGGGNPLVREIESLATLMADRIIAVSQHTKDAIVREYNIPADKIEVVYNHSDPTGIVADDSENAYKYLVAMRAQGYRVIVNVGRLTVQKGLPNLLHAFQKMLAHHPRTLLLIVGNGEQRDELIGLAGELGIGSNVLFAGFQRGKKWRDAYKIADLFVMPSISEPFGLTALEAIGYGTPVMMSYQSGVSEMITNALKTDFWDIDRMANLMAAVVQNDALRDELHTNSLREYLSHSWEESADKLVDLYGQHAGKAAA